METHWAFQESLRQARPRPPRGRGLAMGPVVAAGIALLLAAGAATAAPVPLIGYDLSDADLSGQGGFTHSYDGTITPSGTRGDYQGGTGTLADDAISDSTSETHFFSDLGATLTLFFDDLYTVETIELFGGDLSNNALPGELTSVQVDIGGQSETFSTDEFGTVLNTLGRPVNDRVDLVGSTLDGLLTDSLTLSMWQTTQSAFTLTEVRVNGTLVPEPTTAGLLAAGIAAVAARRRVGRKG